MVPATRLGIKDRGSGNVSEYFDEERSPSRDRYKHLTRTGALRMWANTEIRKRESLSGRRNGANSENI